MNRHRRAAIVLSCFLSSIPLAASLSGEELAPLIQYVKPEFNANFGIVPWNGWLTGTLWGAIPGSEHYDRLHYTMDTTTYTSYAGSVYFPRAQLGFGVNLDVDDNLIGDVSRVMGYLNIQGFTGRVESSTLKGTATWVGSDNPTYPNNPITPDHATSTTFASRFFNVDLLKVIRGGEAGLTLGIGYTSFSLPVQLDLLTLSSSTGEVVSPVNWTYQERMDFQFYSIIFGMNDPLDSAVMGRTDENGKEELTQGFFLWLYDRDRLGFGIAHVSDYEKGVIESITGRTLAGQDSLATLIDFDMTIGIRWLGRAGNARLGFGLGYRLGAQLIISFPLTGSPGSASEVTASPDFYLARGGFILKGSISW